MRWAHGGLIALLLLGVALGWLLRSGAPPDSATHAALLNQEQRTIDLFAQASPSVVYITTLEVQHDTYTLDASAVPRGTGSAFFWDRAGHLVTNYHLIAGADAVQVTVAGVLSKVATVVGIAPDSDLAVLKVDLEGVPCAPITVGSSQNLKVGQGVLAIGNPFGLDRSLSTGVVSALGRTIRSISGREIHGVIQTDATINPGNSGGPLLDTSGRLIGINTAIKSTTGISAGIGFAVPVSIISRVVPQLIMHGRIIRPSIGVRVADDAIRRQLKVSGVLVLGVQPGSAALRAQLKPTVRTRDGRVVLGDVIRSLGPHTIERNDDLLLALGQYAPGDTVELVISRGGETIRVPITLQAPQH
jgi:S1-C subfamily serine protease